MIKLSAEDKKILAKLDAKTLADLSEISEKTAPSLLSVMNLLLEEDKEYFLTINDPDPISLAKKHYAFRSNHAILKSLLRLIKSAQHELSKREEEIEKRK